MVLYLRSPICRTSNSSPCRPWRFPPCPWSASARSTSSDCWCPNTRSTCRCRTRKWRPTEIHWPPAGMHSFRTNQISRPDQWPEPAATRKRRQSWRRQQSRGQCRATFAGRIREIVSFEGEIVKLYITWLPLRNTTNTEPRAVSPHVSRVPSKACVTGPYPWIIVGLYSNTCHLSLTPRRIHFPQPQL